MRLVNLIVPYLLMFIGQSERIYLHQSWPFLFSNPFMAYFACRQASDATYCRTRAEMTSEKQGRVQTSAERAIIL